MNPLDDEEYYYYELPTGSYYAIDVQRGKIFKRKQKETKTPFGFSRVLTQKETT